MTGIFALVTSALLKCVNLVCHKTASPLNRDYGDCAVIVVGASLLKVNGGGHAPDYLRRYDIRAGALHGRLRGLWVRFDQPLHLGFGRERRCFTLRDVGI
jgi:hypothetical protein